MIYLWSCMSWQLDGFNFESISFLHRRGLTFMPEIYTLRSRQQLEGLRRTPYLCGWAFRSLLNYRANIAMDLRYFHEVYYTQFGKRPPTCNEGPSPCNGSSSQNCNRFKNTGVPGARNQSMHDHKCEGSCQRLFWSKESFMSVSGARAVDIASTDSDALRYYKVSERTLTVSHVWSHGQGADRRILARRVQASTYACIAVMLI